MDDDNYNNSGQQVDNSCRVTRFYAILSLVSVVIMVIAAYVTYGYQKREIFVSYPSEEKKIEKKVNESNSSSSTFGINADLSRVPSKKDLKKILNDAMPNVCDDCDEDPLDCLEKYEVNTIFVQNKGYQDQLIIEVVTGKNDLVYTVVIDLKNDNAVLARDGKIDKKMCFDFEEEDVDPKIFLEIGGDPGSSQYLDVPGESE